MESIAEILRNLEAGAGRAIKNCGLLSLWGEVVDGRVGRKTEAVKIENRTLFILTKSSAWAQELCFLKKDIIEKFNQKAGRKVISDIRFRSGG